MKKRRIEIVIAVLIVVIFGGMLTTSGKFSAKSMSICLICGAHKHQVRWPFGFESTPELKDSPLSRWLVQHSRPHDHQWYFLHRTGRNVFGRGISAASSPPAPICRIAPELLERYLQSASEAEVDEFVRVMTNGSESEQEDAVRRIISATTVAKSNKGVKTDLVTRCARHQAAYPSRWVIE